MKRIISAVWLFCWSLSLWAATTSALTSSPTFNNYIQDLNIEMAVQNDSSLYVMEKITLASLNAADNPNWQRLITLRKYNCFGFPQALSANIINLTLDGKSIPYQLDRDQSQLKILIPYSNKPWPHRDVVTLEYQISHVASKGMFEDKLDYALNNDDYSLPIKDYTTTIWLPDNAPVKTYESVLTPTSENRMQAQVANDRNSIIFSSKQPFYPQQAFKFKLQWPTGYLNQTTMNQSLDTYWQANQYIWGIILVFLAAGIYLYFIHKIPSFTQKGTYQRFNHPPAIKSYDLAYQFYQNIKSAFNTIITLMALHRHITIDMTDSNAIKLMKSSLPSFRQDPLLPMEEDLLNALFAKKNQIIINQSNPIVSNALEVLERHLKQEPSLSVPYGLFIRIVESIFIFLIAFFLNLYLPFTIFFAWLTVFIMVGYCIKWMTNLKENVFFIFIGLISSGVILYLLCALIASNTPYLSMLNYLSIVTVVIYSLLRKRPYEHLFNRPKESFISEYQEILSYKNFLHNLPENLNEDTEAKIEFFKKHLPYALSLNIQPDWKSKNLTTDDIRNYLPWIKADQATVLSMEEVTAILNLLK